MNARKTSRQVSSLHWPIVLLVIGWVSVVGMGLIAMARYESTPGAVATAPRTWPEASSLIRPHNRLTLVMFAHPRCPCTRASIIQLAEVMTSAAQSASVHVFFYVPAAADVGWSETETWRNASAISGVTVSRDEQGMEAKRFGARTSGEVLVFDESGNLVFEGGITGARGHAGDNRGAIAVAALLRGHSSSVQQTPVFGCDLLPAATSPVCESGEVP